MAPLYHQLVISFPHFCAFDLEKVEDGHLHTEKNIQLIVVSGTKNWTLIVYNHLAFVIR